MRLCHDGEWRTLLVDDRFPCVARGRADGVPAFAYAARRQLWAGLIEKAYAKLFGCYEALDGGQTEEALETLTGYPCERVEFRADRNRAPRGGLFRGDGDECEGAAAEAERVELAWARLLSFHEAGFLLCASIATDDGAASAAAEAMGLLTDHAYSLLRVVNATTDAGVARLVCLRNPWGKISWRGDWSDGSSRWTPRLREQLLGGGTAASSPSEGAAGTFWIEYSDFRDYFSHAECCRVRPDWAEVRLGGELTDWARAGDGRVDGFELEVLQTCEVEATLIQRGGRGRPDTHAPNDLLLLLARADTLDVVAHSERGFRPSTTCEAVLPAGRYVAIPLSLRPPSSASARSFVLRVGSARPLLCEPRRLDASSVRRALGSFARRAGERQAALSGASGELLVYSVSDAAGWLVYAENPTRMFRFAVQLDFSASFNLLTSRGALTTYDVLPPRHAQLLQCLSLAEAHAASEMRLSSRFSGDLFSAEAHSPELLGGLHRPEPLDAGGRAGGAGATNPLDSLAAAIFG